LLQPFRSPAIALALLLAAPAARAADKVTATYASFDALYAPYFLARDQTAISPKRTSTSS